MDGRGGPSRQGLAWPSQQRDESKEQDGEAEALRGPTLAQGPSQREAALGLESKVAEPRSPHSTCRGALSFPAHLPSLGDC